MGGAGAGGILAPRTVRGHRSRSPRRLPLNPKFFRNGIVMLVLVVGTVALLYTWISSSQTTKTRAYSDFLADVQAGKVDKVVQQSDTLSVDLKGGTPNQPDYTVTVPGVPGLHDVYKDIQTASANPREPLYEAN